MRSFLAVQFNNFRMHAFFPYCVLTTGQTIQIMTPLDLPANFGNYVFIKIDFLSNTIWKMLDQPKTILTLVRFTRKYLNDNSELIHEQIKTNILKTANKISNDK